MWSRLKTYWFDLSSVQFSSVYHEGVDGITSTSSLKMSGERIEKILKRQKERRNNDSDGNFMSQPPPKNEVKCLDKGHNVNISQFVVIEPATSQPTLASQTTITPEKWSMRAHIHLTEINLKPAFTSSRHIFWLFAHKSPSGLPSDVT